MKKIDTKDVIAVVGGSDLSELRFVTKDGEQAFVLAMPLSDGTRFIVPEDDEETESDCVHVHGEAEPLLAWGGLTGIYDESEDGWELEANQQLEDFDLKLGGQHRMPVIIENRIYDDGWYELRTV